ncbi:uncharacterized protein BcabD6B2_16160 [Babesia caballi]|uniref:PH domain-containing protein n=1 Tax=Babesia caballi TaxID=5871 RepID=A0AAV4LQQ7_BABCB|nr:hypothetical protein, conserved [Babesia caballi]
MYTPNTNRSFGEAAESVIMAADLENRGCQLVSPARSAESDTDHISALNKLKTLLDTPAGCVPSGERVPEPVKAAADFSTPDFASKTHDRQADPDHLPRHVQRFKGVQDPSPAGSNISDMSQASAKSRDRTKVLQHAEAVIEYQRERINALEAAIAKFNAALTETNNMYQQELQRQIDDNLALRNEMQKVVTEFEVLSKRYQLDLGEADSLKQKVNFFSHDLAKKDQELAELRERTRQLPLDNEELKAKNRMLSEEVERLGRELRGVNLLEAKRSAQPPSASVAGTTQACAAQHERLKASSKCIAQLENDLQAYKRLTESMSMDIKRLNYQLAKQTSAAKPNNYLASAQRQMLQFRSLFVQLAKQAREQQPAPPQVTVDEDLHNRSLYAVQNVKASAELHEMCDKLLEATRNIYRHPRDGGLYNTVVRYTCGATDEDLHLQVLESILVLSRDEEEQLVELARIPLNAVLGVKKAMETNEFHIHTNDPAIHVLRTGQRDAFNRLYYALQYAGFITEDVRFSIFSQVDFSYLPSNFSWPSNAVVVLAAESSYKGRFPESIAAVRRTMGEIYVITDPAERLMTIDENVNALVVLGPQMSSVPLTVPCDRVLAVRLCDSAHVDCDDFEHVDAPIATLANGASTAPYFISSSHTFAFVFQSTRVLFVKGFDSDNEKRLLALMRKGRYLKAAEPREEHLPELDTPVTPPQSHAPVGAHSDTPPADVRAREAAREPTETPPADSKSTKVYEFIGDDLYLYRDQDENVVLEVADGTYRVNEASREVAVSSGASGIYVLSFPSIDAMRDFVRDLELHGFKQHQEAEESRQQVCIVMAGCLQLFHDTNEAPIATFNNHDTTISINESRYEISISSTGDDKLAMKLDCINSAELRRWKFALGFAGFIKTSMKARPGDALKKYIFPIKIFDDKQAVERRAFQVDANSIRLFVNPTVRDPMLTFPKSDVSLELVDSERRLRLYVNRYSKMEERFDFLLSMLRDYQTLKTALQQHGYSLDAPRGKSPKLHFVLAKQGLIAIHRSKYDTDPQLLLDRKHYAAEVSHMNVKFVSKSDSSKVIAMRFKADFNFRRWVMALKVAGYLPLTSEKVPILYMPTIVYSHICPEIPTLLKGHLKR